MRRPRKSIGWVVPAAVALLCLPVAALAEHVMTFRQLPAESLDAIAHSGTRPSARPHEFTAGGTINGKDIMVRIDSAGSVNIHLPAGTISDDSSDTAEASASSSESGRETTGEIVRFGNDIEVPVQQVVTGDVVSMGGSVRVRGTVRGSVTSMGGDVTLGPTSRVDGDVVCLGGTLHESPGASVGGQRVTAPRVPGGHLLLPVLSVVGTGVKVLTQVMSMLLMLLVAFILIKVAPDRTQRALDLVRTDGVMSFMVGLLAWGLLIPSLVVLALAVAVLAITIIGIPLAIVVLLGYAAVLVLLVLWGAVIGYSLFGGALRTRFAGQPVDLMGAAMWGIVGLYALRVAGTLLHIVPLFGFLGGLVKVLVVGATIVLGTLGAGALIRSEYERRTVQSWWQRSYGRRGRREDDFPPPPTPGVTPVADTPPPADVPPPPPADVPPPAPPIV